jgi:Family of unknown function (DUF5681)
MKFLPGQSGNPAGRPPGARNKKTLALEAAYEAKAEEAVTDIMERAKSGDPAAMRLCMDRAVPIGRHRRFAFALPRIRTPEDAETAIDVVMDGLAEGALSLAEVAEMLRIVERLLAMAENIGEMKRVRDFIARRPAVEPDQDAVQQALAGAFAAARGLNAQQDGEKDDANADGLYFPVNHRGNAPDASVGPSGSPHDADRPAGGPPSTPGRQTVSESVAA